MLRKFATATILEARTWDDTRRTAHRASFLYVPREGFIYVRSRAISSRTNDNFDNFPAEEIEKSWRSFIGKPVFVNHHNSDHRRARGVIIDAALHHDQNPDGSPDTWVELLHEVDARRFPKLAEAILSGWVERTSMGCDVAFSICSACGNKASTPMDYCRHIPSMKGQKIRRKNASTGSTEDVLVYEKCYGLGFFENSLLVEDPADPTALFLDVDDRGVGGGYKGELQSLHNDVLPGNSPLDSSDERLGDPVTSGDLGFRQLTTATLAGGRQGQQVPLDDEDISLDELRRVVAATYEAAAPGNHVGGVVGVGPLQPVQRVVAQREVARVAHDVVRAQRADKLGVTPPVRADARPLGVAQREAAVATPSERPSRPGPTGVRSTAGVDLGQVPLHLGLGAQELSGARVDRHAREDTRASRTAAGAPKVAWKRDQADDPHSLVNLDPANYEWLEEFDLGYADEIEKSISFISSEMAADGMFPSKDLFLAEYAEIAEWEADLARIKSKCIEGRPFRENVRCDHCGTIARYFSVFRFKPTGEWLCVGHTCAENRLGLDTKDDLNKARHQWVLQGLQTKKENAEKDRKFNADPRRVKVRDFLYAYRDLVARREYREVGFYEDLLRSLKQYHDLTDNQLNAVERGMDKFNDEVEEFALRRRQELTGDGPSTPCPTGTQTITGKVLSTKWQESQYGSTLKMLVRDDRGFKVWGSVPSSLSVERMDRVTFIATVEPSGDDPTFGFFKRPRRAEILPRTASMVGSWPSDAPSAEPIDRTVSSGAASRRVMASSGGASPAVAEPIGSVDSLDSSSVVRRTSSASSGSPRPTGNASSRPRVASAPSVGSQRAASSRATSTASPSITTTSPARSVASSARSATPPSASSAMTPTSSGQPSPTWRSDSEGTPMPRTAARVATPMHHHAYGETMAPAQVSTIRDDACPVCGDTDGFNGERCQTCAYFRPPGEFMDPDLTKAQNVDLRQGDEESGEINADGDTDNVFDLDQPGDEDGALGAPQVGADGQPVAPEVATVDEDGKPIAADGAEVKVDENGDPIVPSDPLVGGENAAPGDPTDPDGKVLDHNDPNVVDPKAKVDGTVNANPAPVGTDPRAEVVKVPTRTESPLPDPHPRAPQPGQGPRLKGDTFELTKPVEQPAAPAEEVKAPAPAKSEAPDTAPKTQSDDKDDDDEDSDEDDPKSKKKTNPFTKKTSRNGREADDMRPTLRALAEQQIRQDAQDKKIRLIANVAGLDFGSIDREAAQRIARLRRQADTENPAQPVENPAPEAPSESTGEALAPEAKADVESVGTAGATDVTPEATVDVEAVGTAVPVESTDTLDVEKPVSGTELAENTTETQGDVTAQGLNADTAFEINPGFAKGSAKIYASIRLARLRQQAGIADPNTEDLALGAHIASTMTADQINAEIKTLDAVTRTAARQPRPMGAGSPTPPQVRETRRTMPSLTSTASQQPPSFTPAAGFDDDSLMFID